MQQATEDWPAWTAVALPCMMAWVPHWMQPASTVLSMAVPLQPGRVLMLCLCWQSGFCTNMGAQ